jgi:hypothetical protein
MIIFTDNKNIFCYLFNPKCGCYTFNDVILPQIKKYNVLYHATKPLHHGCSYNSFEYYHCNLEAAINYMQKNNIDCSKVIFFTLIREPIKRYISAYNYTLDSENIKKFCNDSKNMDEDFENYLINNEHYRNFIPSKFRFYKQYSVNNVIRLENLQDDLNTFFKKYNLNIDCSKISETKLNVSTNKEKIYISEKNINIIKEMFKEDYISGNY